MITLKEWMEIIEYRITEGSEFYWTCFGDNAYSLSTWNGDHDGYSMYVTFDLKDQTVYMVEACDYKRSRAYRFINPDHRDTYKDYARKHNPEHADQAWDDVRYVDLETREDFLEKAQAIVAGEDYDTRVVVPLDMPDDVAFQLMRMAHEQDITFNEFLTKVLSEEIERMAEQHPELQEKTASMKRSKTSKES